MNKSIEINTVLQLVRIGLGISPAENYHLPSGLDWEEIVKFSRRQGLVGVMADGLGAIPVENMPDRRVIMKIMGSAGKYEKKYDMRALAVSPLAKIWHREGIRIVLLKGMAFARYYPIPKHRSSSDVDVFLCDEGELRITKSELRNPKTKTRKQDNVVSAYERGNRIARELGLPVDAEIQKHSQIGIKGVMIENHCRCCGQLEHKPIAALEDYLEGMLGADDCEVMEGTCYELPPLMFDALFYIYHSRVHFVIEGGILFKHVLDWVMIRKAVVKNGKLDEVRTLCERFGMSKFYEAIDGVADYVEGRKEYDSLDKAERLMVEDIFDCGQKSKVESRGTEGDVKEKKLRSMFARRFGMLVEIYDNRWKYPVYSDVSFVNMMWIYVKGYLRRMGVRRNAGPTKRCATKTKTKTKR